MSVSDLTARMFEANHGEKFAVSGFGNLFADRVKRPYASIEYNGKRLTGALIIDFDQKPVFVGDGGFVLVYDDGSDRWVPGKAVLMTEDGSMEEISSKEGELVGAFESVVCLYGKSLLEGEPAENLEKNNDETVVKVKYGTVPALIRDTENARQMYPELIGKMGYVVEERHTPNGLWYYVAIGEDVYRVSWGDIKRRN